MVAPELAVPGKTTAVLITLHGPASLQPLNVTLRLLPDPAQDFSEDGPSTLANDVPLVIATQEIKGNSIFLCISFFFT